MFEKLKPPVYGLANVYKTHFRGGRPDSYPSYRTEKWSSALTFLTADSPLPFKKYRRMSDQIWASSLVTDLCINYHQFS